MTSQYQKLRKNVEQQYNNNYIFTLCPIVF